MLRSLILAALLAFAFWLSQAMIYEPIIVPALENVVVVPLGWWMTAIAPELVVCAIATWLFRNIAEGVVFCLMGGLAVTTAQFVAGTFNWPGHLKVVEGGLLQFAVQLGVVSTLLAATVSVLAIARFGVQRVRAG